MNKLETGMREGRKMFIFSLSNNIRAKGIPLGLGILELEGLKISQKLWMHIV